MKQSTIGETEKVTQRMNALTLAIDVINNKVKYDLLSGPELEAVLDDKRDYIKEYDQLKNRLFDLNQEGGSNA